MINISGILVQFFLVKFFACAFHTNLNQLVYEIFLAVSYSNSDLFTADFWFFAH